MFSVLELMPINIGRKITDTRDIMKFCDIFTFIKKVSFI